MRIKRNKRLEPVGSMCSQRGLEDSYDIWERSFIFCGDWHVRGE